jgi:hypothetical protein
MQNLTHAHRELFQRSPDETFSSLAALHEHCLAQRTASHEDWVPPNRLTTRPLTTDQLLLAKGNVEVEKVDQWRPDVFHMNDWSFSQLCRLAGVSKDTVNQLTSDTACRVFGEMLPRTGKPLQLFTEGDRLRSIHAASYTRLHNAEVISMVREFAVDFQPPQTGVEGGTGLYAGEQDMFCFLIDPTGWAEINGEAFAPGFFVWNSEVGRRTVGISTFWFQAVCQNHIVWDATEVVEFTRKHTARVGEALADIRRILLELVEKRDARRDGFVQVVRKAMDTTLGSDAEEVEKLLGKQGITRDLAKRALEVAKEHGRFTVFALVDALTRIAQETKYVGDRNEADQKAARLLALVA